MRSEKARAFWIAEPGRGEIRDVVLPSPGPGEIRVRTRFSGVSRGTESLVFTGHVPVSEHARMRAPFQEGAFPAPVKYGYMNVGLVEEGPDDLAGRHVFVLFPHQTHFVVPASWAHPVPEGLPLRRAVLAANMETAINVLWDARPHVGDRIAVIGAGTVGCLCAGLAAQVAGCRVALIDRNPDRAGIAAALGADFATPDAATSEADLVIHASGSPEGLALALRLAGQEAVVIEASWFGDRMVPLALGEAFHARRLTVRASQVGTIAPAQQPRWDTGRRMRLALELLQDARFDGLLTGESAFDALPGTMARLAGGAPDTLCHVVTYA